MATITVNVSLTADASDLAAIREYHRVMLGRPNLSLLEKLQGDLNAFILGYGPSAIAVINDVQTRD